MALKIPRIPPMAEMIEDYANPTKDLCVNCRQRNRFYFLQEIIVADATPKTPREFFRVCPRCDVDEDARP